MAPRFDTIKFNLMRTIEILGDLNAEDMDVTAPPSNHEYYKEYEVADKLNECLTQLINDGFFDDCDPRPETGDDNEESEGLSTPESEGFDYDHRHGSDASRESFAGRFKRYVRRMLPGGAGLRSRRQSEPEGEQSEQTTDYSDEEDGATNSTGNDGGSQSASRRSQSSRASSRSVGSRRLYERASRARERRQTQPGSASGASRQSSGSYRSQAGRERSGSEPYSASVVYEHNHRHKHNHPGSHHHHDHSAGSHQHTYHRHADEELASTDNDDYEGNDGLSGVYRAVSNDDLGTANSTASYRTRSSSNGRRRRGASGSRSRSTSRSRGA